MDFWNTLNPFSVEGGTPNGAMFGEYGLLTNPTGAWDIFKNGRTNEINKEIAEQNLAFQRENLDYNRALNEEIFNRADTAYQRQVADMRAAGLNPLMAQGGAETGGSVTPTEAIHNDYQHTDIGDMSGLQGIGDLLNTIQNYQIGFDFGREQKAKADSATAQATVDKQTALDKIWNSHLDKQTKEFLNYELWRENEYNNEFGINKSMSENERMAQIMAKAFENENHPKYGLEQDREFINKGQYLMQRTEDKNQDYKNLASNLIIKELAEMGSDILTNIDFGKMLFGGKTPYGKGVKGFKKR